MPPSSETVKVTVRCRPLSAQEEADRRGVIVHVDEGRSELQIHKEDGSDPRTFTYDQVYGMTSTQDQIFERTARPIIDSCLEGYNGTIFAYGQTGAGKSFTMEGKDEPANLRGIIPNALNYIFSRINSTSGGSGSQVMVYISYLEIYNEELRDLLAPPERLSAVGGKAGGFGSGGGAKAHLELKESKERGVYVKDLQQFAVKDVEEANSRLQAGRKARHVGAHAMNAESSRSHSLLTIALVAVEKLSAAHAKADDAKMHVGKLNLVDLAGSERQSKTQATGERLKEGSAINQSLSALGNVISALVDGKAAHVPYRDSKLTRLLQDSLGGNTKTVMIANVGPAGWNYEETMSTLRYASRAKKISNKPRVNNAITDSSVAQYADEIAKINDAHAEQIARMKASYEAQLIEREAEVERLRAQMQGEGARRSEHSTVIRQLREQAVASQAAIEAVRTEEQAKMQQQLAEQVAAAKAQALAEAKAAAQVEIEQARIAAQDAARKQVAAEIAAAKEQVQADAARQKAQDVAFARASAASEVQARADADIAAARAEAAAAEAKAAAAVATVRAKAEAEAQAQAAKQVAAAQAQAAAAQQAAERAAQAATVARDSATTHAAAESESSAASTQREVAGVKAEAQTQLTQLQAQLEALQARGASVDDEQQRRIAQLMKQVEQLQARSAAERAKTGCSPVTGRSMRADQGFTELFETLVLEMGYDADASREAILGNPHSTMDVLVDYIAAHEDIMANWRHLQGELG